MFDFFKDKKKDENKENILVKTAALLIHAAKIDENYNEIEKKIIKKTISDLGVKENEIERLIDLAEKYENNSNQILEFTKEIKKYDQKFKIKVIETLWKIIYSDSKEDIYEANLMRRLTGLLYLDSKTVGKIKEKIQSSKK